MQLPKRKQIRLKDYDYSQDGYYFITMCTKDKRKLLCDIVGTGILDGPQGMGLRQTGGDAESRSQIS